MTFEERGNKDGRTLMLLPGTCCDWQVNFGKVMDHLEKRYHLIYVEGTTAHFIYANKMGERYKKRYLKYFRDPDIREFDMQHEQWLFGGREYAEPVLRAIDEFMGIV